MNILEFIEEQKDVEQLSVDYRGQKVKFWVKNLSQHETEQLNGSNTALLNVYEKQKKGVQLTEDEAKTMFSYESNNSYQLLCKKDGEPLYSTLEEFKKKIKGAFLRAVNAEIREFIKADDEEAEKN